MCQLHVYENNHVCLAGLSVLSNAIARAVLFHPPLCLPCLSVRKYNESTHFHALHVAGDQPN